MAKRGRRFSGINDFEDWLESVAPDRFSRARSNNQGNFAALYDAVVEALQDDEDTRQRKGLEAAASDLVPVPRWAVMALLSDMFPLAVRSSAKRLKEWERDQLDWRRFTQVYYKNIAQRSGDRPTRAEIRRRREAYRREIVKRAAKPRSRDERDLELASSLGLALE